MICSTLANYAGKVRADGSAQAVPADFMPLLAESRPASVADQPLLMATPEAQAELIKNTLFKGL